MGIFYCKNAILQFWGLNSFITQKSRLQVFEAELVSSAVTRHDLTPTTFKLIRFSVLVREFRGVFLPYRETGKLFPWFCSLCLTKPMTLQINCLLMDCQTALEERTHHIYKVWIVALLWIVPIHFENDHQSVIDQYIYHMFVYVQLLLVKSESCTCC